MTKLCPHCGILHDDDRIEDVRGCRDRLAAQIDALVRALGARDHIGRMFVLTEKGRAALSEARSTNAR